MVAAHASGQLTVNLGALELSCRNTMIEQQVNFPEGTVLGLRKSEPAPQVTQKICACIEETGFGSPIPSWQKSQPQLEIDQRGLSDSPIGESIRGVTELLKMPVRLYTNLPITMVLYRKRPEGVSATMG